MNEEEKVHQFLMDLDANDDYSIFQSQIFTLDPLPLIYKIFNMVQQEENHEKIMINWDAEHENMVAFVVSDVTWPSVIQDEKINCKYYWKPGHEEANYLKLIGYLLGGVNMEAETEANKLVVAKQEVRGVWVVVEGENQQMLHRLRVRQ